MLATEHMLQQTQNFKTETRNYCFKVFMETCPVFTWKYM